MLHSDSSPLFGNNHYGSVLPRTDQPSINSKQKDSKKISGLIIILSITLLTAFSVLLFAGGFRFGHQNILDSSLSEDTDVNFEGSKIYDVASDAKNIEPVLGDGSSSNVVGKPPPHPTRYPTRSPRATPSSVPTSAPVKPLRLDYIPIKILYSKQVIWNNESYVTKAVMEESGRLAIYRKNYYSGNPFKTTPTWDLETYWNAQHPTNQFTSTTGAYLGLPGSSTVALVGTDRTILWSDAMIECPQTNNAFEVVLYRNRKLAVVSYEEFNRAATEVIVYEFAGTACEVGRMGC